MTSSQTPVSHRVVVSCMTNSDQFSQNRGISRMWERGISQDMGISGLKLSLSRANCDELVTIVVSICAVETDVGRIITVN